MNVIFTCGGTGGHINPAIAVANIWKERHPESKILFIGGRGNMEEELVPKAGYPLEVLPAFGLERSLSPAAFKNNFRAVKSVLSAVKKCKKIMRDFDADVVVGTGGYASFPALYAAHKLKIPTCVHEANAMPGLTTRMAAKWTDKVLVCFPESVKHYRCPEKVEVVGMPVRREFIYTQKADARKELGLDAQPLVVSAFGSQGAKAMNEMTAKLFAMEQEKGFPFRHIHAVGSYGWGWMPDFVKAQGVELEKSPAIQMREYIYNMPTVMAAADVIISRAGASSCSEIAASGTPCVLIPSPNVTDNHQEKNARALEAQGGAVVILEKDCTPQRLYGEITALLDDKDRYSAMRKALYGISVPDSAERLCAVMEQLAKKKE
ncbi:MAG: undecaprenyldiphospho-muramoylpentapeptide beta-N-acetylglucosaminyltransferase [Oscillospiraceae bacterium]|nr:undecaprenyldiphospho-muramoylpentapeptide beta-N-acetylglucosaminyltransferase [Oscillospiraceae bacterium]